MKYNKIPEESEYEQHKSVYKFVQLMTPKYPDLEMFWSSMNGMWIQGRAKWAIIAMMKAVGCMPKGYPDMGLDVARRGFHGLRIELKTKKGRLSEEQEWWLKMLAKQGYFAIVCKGEEEAKKAIIYYLEGKIKK